MQNPDYFSGFLSEEKRNKYARRLAEEIVDALQDDPKLAHETIVTGRIGLAQMSDRQLYDTGVDGWGVDPTLTELGPGLH